MTLVQRLAGFVRHAAYGDLSPAACEALKGRVLDALGTAVGALGAPPPEAVRRTIEELGGRPLCSLIGGGRTAPDRAALYNGALVRYLDFNDSYLAPGETFHPSDNLGAVLAAAELAGASGGTFLTALGVAYEVQARLSEAAPVRARGFDHTTQGAYAAAAGASRALGLDETQTAHALAISGTANNALRVTRTGHLSHWKGLAYPYVGCAALQATLLARQGITGPMEVFEGNKGFMESIAGRFEVDWGTPGLESVTRTIVKRYNAEIHSQSAIEGLLELQAANRFGAEDVEKIELETFDVAFNIIGGGEEGDKHAVSTKEEADHSLPYLLAVALLDGFVGPEQYAPDRISRADVQALLRRVSVRPSPDLNVRFPRQMPARLFVTLTGGRRLTVEKSDYQGFFTHPMSWEGLTAKFDRLAASRAPEPLRREIVAVVHDLQDHPVTDLTRLLSRVSKEM